MTKPHTCPNCGTHDTLFVNLLVPYELKWRSNGEARIGGRTESDFYLPSAPDRDTPAGCGNCGWEGQFSELKLPVTAYTVTLCWETTETEDGNGNTGADAIEARVKRMLALYAASGANIHDKLTVVSVGETE